MDNTIIHNETDDEALANFAQKLPADYAWITPTPELLAWSEKVHARSANPKLL